MQRKPKEKQQAIILRKQGLSLREIQQKLHVSKSTLSLWLRDTPLAPEQMLTLLKKRENSWVAAGAKRHQMRLEEEENEFQKAKNEVGMLSDRDLFLIAISLYWGEGDKQRLRPSKNATISNSDPAIILIFYIWIKKFMPSVKISCTLYIHEHYRLEEGYILDYWKSYFSDPTIQWNKIVFKKHIKNKPFMRYNREYPIDLGRKRSGLYNGLIRLTVRKSTRLNRFLSGCSKAIGIQCPVV